ncbi:MAG TPA: DinB family protein [Gemmataceae bacterium]|nr:DinB family protein [Gemmataceae bacterium]
MDPGIKPWLDLWDYLDGNFWSVWQWASRELSPEEVGWQPVPQVASVGWNLQHLAEMLDHYLAHVFNRGPQVWLGPLVTMRRASQDDGRFRDLQAIADYHKKVRPAFRGYLASRTLADLERPLDPSGRGSHTYSWAVGHIAEHESYHLGKVTLLRNLLSTRTMRPSTGQA